MSSTIHPVNTASANMAMEPEVGPEVAPEVARVLAGWEGRAELARLGGGERQLWEATERALRHPAGKLAVVLHLSRLSTPRDHHLRVARVLLQDTAQRHHGQVFTLANRDLALLCSAEPPGQSGLPHAPSALPRELGRLFAADVAEEAGLTTLWALESQAGELLAYLSARVEGAGAGATAGTLPGQPVVLKHRPTTWGSPPEKDARRKKELERSPAGSFDAMGSENALATLQEIVLNAPLAGLVTQQMGMSLSRDRSLPLAGRLAPAYLQVGIDLAALRLDRPVAQAIGDPFLFRHFAETLDVRLIQLLRDDLAQHGRLQHSIISHGVPVLIELGLRAIVSPAFATLSRLGRSAGLQFWVAVSLLQAGTEPDLLDNARGVLKLAGARLVLNRVDPAVLSLADPAALLPDILMLPWSQRLVQSMAGLPPRAVPLVILENTDGEPAIGWGQARGIALFQGPFLDQVQAATRMQRCPSASGCTMGQCRTRAAALALPGRAGCANPGLLELGFAEFEPTRGRTQAVA